MSNTCYSLGCSENATKMLELGWTWPDGRQRYTPACDQHFEKVVTHQLDAFEITVIVHPVGTVVQIPTCIAGWRSHACSLAGDHEGDHICDPKHCGDSPRPDDDVINYLTDERVARTGGVPKTISTEEG